MEEQEPSVNIDHPETAFPSPQLPITEAHDETGSAAPSSPAAQATRPALTQRLAEAFREGVVSARPDCEQRRAAGISPGGKNIRQAASEAGIGEKVIREGGAAAAVVGDKAAGVLGAFARLVKKAPSLTQKYAEAFRDGAASVKPRAGKEPREERPAAVKAREATADGRAILGRLFNAGESAAGFVREAVSVVKPGEVIGARQKIRLGQKKINQLYIDIGGETANSWSGWPVETEKLTALLAELQKNEEEIRNLQAHLAEEAAAGKTEARRPQTIKKEAIVTPATDQPDSSVGDPGVKPDEPVDHVAVDHPEIENQEEQVFGEPENRDDRSPHPDVVDAADAPVPAAEAPEETIVSQDRVDGEAAPPEKEGGAGAALESAVAANAGQEESDSEAGPALPEEPELRQEKKDEREKGSDG